MDLDLSKRSKPCFKKNRTMSMGKVKNPFLKVCGIGLLTVICISVKAQKVNFTVNSKTGAIQSMNIDNDKQNMNWLIATDGSQYPWIKENYGWGLGYFTEVRRNQKNKKKRKNLIKTAGKQIKSLQGKTTGNRQKKNKIK